MDVYDFLNLATDLSGVTVTVFDINSGKVVFDGKDSDDLLYDMENEIQCYEVASYDLFKDKDGRLCLELNISVEEEDE